MHRLFSHLSDNHRGILIMILSTLAFSFMGASVKLATQTLPSSEVVFFRAFLMVLFILPTMIQKKISFWRTNKFLLFLRSLAGFTALSLSFYVTSKIRLGDASILNHTSVIFVAILSVLFLEEVVSKGLITCIIVAFLGAGLIVKPGFDVVNIPGLLGLLGGFCSSISYVSIKRLHDTDSYLTIVFNFGFWSSLLAIILFANQFRFPVGIEIPTLLAVGAFSTIGQVFMTYAFKLGDASDVSPCQFVGVIFSMFWGALFWSELPDFVSLLGTILVIGGGIGIIRLQDNSIS